MNSATDIANTALAHLGVGYEIQNFDTDTSKEARVMRRYYSSLRKSLIGSYAWWWATVYQKLPLISFYPTPQWPFQYAQPTDCLKMIRIWNYRDTDNVENEINFVESNNGTQNTILSKFGPTQLLPSNPWVPTNAPGQLPANSWPIPVMEFVADTENVNLMSEMFKQAFAFILAAYAAPSLPGIGQTDLREKNLQLGINALNAAIAQDRNQSRPKVDQHSIIQSAGQSDRVYLHGVSWQAFNPGLPPA